MQLFQIITVIVVIKGRLILYICEYSILCKKLNKNGAAGIFQR